MRCYSGPPRGAGDQPASTPRIWTGTSRSDPALVLLFDARNTDLHSWWCRALVPSLLAQTVRVDSSGTTSRGIGLAARLLWVGRATALHTSDVIVEGPVSIGVAPVEASAPAPLIIDDPR